MNGWLILLGLALVACLATRPGRYFLAGLIVGLFPGVARGLRNALLIRLAGREMEKKK